MGELEPWIDENFVRSVWFGMGEQVNVKMIRDKFSGNAGYCFIDFTTPEAAAKALSLNGSMIPNTSRPFKLNWASGGGLADRRDDRGPEFSIFVGDLGPEVNEYVLVSLFQSRFPSCKSAKIMTDPISGMSRGYGFVRFSDEGDQQRALTEMQGVYCGNRPMRISTATPKNKSGGGGPPGAMGGMPGAPMGGNMAPGMYSMGAPPIGYYGAPQPMNQFTDPNNTTVFVGGLSGYVTEDELRSFFQGFGEITYVKIPPGKGCGFVQVTPSETLVSACPGDAPRTTLVPLEPRTDRLHRHHSTREWACHHPTPMETLLLLSKSMNDSSVSLANGVS
ncbi:hypothetical protein V491_07217, partial [Pseudogymnoascus sp. VKM F-3775]